MSWGNALATGAGAFLDERDRQGELEEKRRKAEREEGWQDKVRSRTEKEWGRQDEAYGNQQTDRASRLKREGEDRTYNVTKRNREEADAVAKSKSEGLDRKEKEDQRKANAEYAAELSKNRRAILDIESNKIKFATHRGHWEAAARGDGQSEAALVEAGEDIKPGSLGTPSFTPDGKGKMVPYQSKDGEKRFFFDHPGMDDEADGIFNMALKPTLEAIRDDAKREEAAELIFKTITTNDPRLVAKLKEDFGLTDNVLGTGNDPYSIATRKAAGLRKDAIKRSGELTDKFKPDPLKSPEENQMDLDQLIESDQTVRAHKKAAKSADELYLGDTKPGREKGKEGEGKEDGGKEGEGEGDQTKTGNKAGAPKYDPKAVKESKMAWLTTQRDDLVATGMTKGDANTIMAQVKREYDKNGSEAAEKLMEKLVQKQTRMDQGGKRLMGKIFGAGNKGGIMADSK